LRRRLSSAAARIEKSPQIRLFLADPGLDDVDDVGRRWIKIRPWLVPQVS